MSLIDFFKINKTQLTQGLLLKARTKQMKMHMRRLSHRDHMGPRPLRLLSCCVRIRLAGMTMRRSLCVGSSVRMGVRQVGQDVPWNASHRLRHEE